MDLTSWILEMLEDAHNKSITNQNRDWLYQNVNKLHICICPEDCIVDTSYIEKAWEKNGTKLIQEGEEVTKDDFHPEKEALLLVKNKSLKFNLEDTYMVFLYYPKE